MKALTQSQALMTSALLEWCGRDWWSWECQEALAFTTQSWWTKPACAPWPSPPPSYWPSNLERNWKEQSYKVKKNVRANQNEKKRWICIPVDRYRQRTGATNTNIVPLTFLHVTQITGNGFKGFFPVRFTLIPPLSLHLTDLMSRSSQSLQNINLLGTRYFVEGLSFFVQYLGGDSLLVMQ